MNPFRIVLDAFTREGELEQQLAKVTRERDALRRHLQNIRTAHEPLYAAIHPGLKGKSS